MLAAAAWTLWGCGAVADTWRLEAEAAGEGTIQKPPVASHRPYTIHLKVMDTEDASGGQYLGGQRFDGETHPLATRIPHAGNYRVWVRHYKTLGKPTSLFVLVRDDIRASAGLRRFDFVPRAKNLTALPRPAVEAPEDAQPVWAWESADYTFERPMDASVSFGAGHGESSGNLGIDCVVISDDLSYDPRKSDWAKLPSEPGAPEPVTPPKGFQPAPVFTTHSSFFAGAPDRDDQIMLTLVQGYAACYDYPTMLQWGFNRTRGHGGSVEYGIQVQTSTSAPYYRTLELLREVPSPEGRRTGYDGTVREKRFSLAYEPYRKAYHEAMLKGIAAYNDRPEVERFSVMGEAGGVFDYADVNRDGFHRWLEKHFGSIKKLNECWRTEYESFDDVPLPQRPEGDENKAAFFAFRKYNSELTSEQVAENVAAVNAADKHGRQATCQLSCLHINSPWFTSSGCIDFEDVVNIAMAESKLVGYDAYSTADYFVGCDLEYLLSLAADKHDVLNNEFNTHGQDPRIMAATYWGMIAKGVKGIDIWQSEDNPRSWVYSMWAMLRRDGTPRDKLGAAADANHEIHRLERMLRPAKRRHLVKPVALYYSRMDLSLPQPLFDIYGSSIDSPYRVYAVLRGLGYPVRWITPRQIEAGQLENVGAVALVGVKYVPHEAAQKLADWVEDGGCIIGDAWPGAYDQYDRPQGTLIDVFGIRAREGDAPKQLTPDEARQALSEQATPVYAVDQSLLKSLAADQFYKSVDEMFNQPDSHHPIAEAVGDWHLSGYDGKSVQVVSGEIIGQMMGQPGIVVNDYGKGHAFYCAAMLGTLYEAGPVRFEWDTGREGPGFRNLLGAFLDYGAVEPFATPDLPWGVARKMRIEPPLVDGENNFLIGMISLNDAPLSDFPLTLAWPRSAPVPKMMLACTGGSRQMQQVDFEIKDGMLRLTMPGFDTHATLLGLRQSDPLVSLDVEGAPRGVAGLLDVTPKSRLKLKAKVWNPSKRKLPAGEVELYTAPGWFCDKASAPLDSVDAWGTAEVTFDVAAPSLCAAKALHPIVVRFETDKISSTPCSELVWWLPKE